MASELLAEVARDTYIRLIPPSQTVTSNDHAVSYSKNESIQYAKVPRYPVPTFLRAKYGQLLIP